MFGENFCEEFASSQKTKTKGSLGLSPQNAKIGFITQTPLLDRDCHFLLQKSSEILENIITKFFNFSIQDCCILSLFKTQEIPQNEEIKQHIQILHSQISQSSPQVFVLFGDIEITQPLFGKGSELGNVVDFKNKKLITTHSLKALIKLPLLKKQTLEHLKIAKAFL